MRGNNKKRLICFHVFNDYSGSPKVLRLLLHGMAKKGVRIDLYTSRGGVLDELENEDNIRIHHFHYMFCKNPVKTIIYYATNQLALFFVSFRYLFDSDSIFYINTIVPVLPAIAGKIIGKRVVYHYHENARFKGVHYRLRAWIMEKIADSIICVSHFQASFLKSSEKVSVVSNALPEDFISRLKPHSGEAFKGRTILMLSSLKDYKGVIEFIRLSEMMPEYKFQLVVNDNEENIEDYLRKNRIKPGGNVRIFPKQEDVVPFYNNCGVLLNLTDRNKAVETFGMTVLEALSCGLPAIVPTVGGIAELIDDGFNGYKIDVANLEAIRSRIEAMFCEEQLYMSLSLNAIKSSSRYASGEMVDRIAEIIGLE
jgi:Glycosyltransferase